MPTTRASASSARSAGTNIKAKKWQKEILKTGYQENPNPTDIELETFAEKTQLPGSWVKSWFTREQKKTRLVVKQVSNLDHAWTSTSANHFSYMQNGILISQAIAPPGHLPLHLTRSPSLGYIPLAFPTSYDSPTTNSPQSSYYDTDVTASVYSTPQDVQGSQTDSRCYQLLSEVTEQLAFESDAKTETGLNHDYSSFLAGVPSQHLINPRDFSAYSLSTNPSQSSTNFLPPSALRNLIAGRLLSHHKPLDATQSSQSQPVSVSIKLGQLRDMSRRITAKYNAYLATTRMEEETNQSLWELVSLDLPHAGFGRGDPSTPSSVIEHGSEDTENESHEAITPGSTNILPPQTLSGQRKNSHAAVGALHEGFVPSFAP